MYNFQIKKEYVWVLETESHYVVLADLELTM